MTYCLNPNCLKNQNAGTAKFCHSCGSKLMLKERYRAIETIGKGGFSRTFLAVDEDKPSKPYCIIKQFFPQTQGTHCWQKAAELFEQEAIRLDELGHHPQIPELLAHFNQDERQYLVQEFIDGENLAQVLQTEGIFNETQIWSLLNNLLPVFDFIHSHQVIHRDIKPSNIIRCHDGRIFLVDFGAAKYVTETALLKTGTTIGTPEFVSPEQAKGKAVFASDLYSLGVTCIYLLTQVSPFDLFDTSENTWVWRQYLVNNPVSDELSCILDKLIITGTKKRYQSASEVLVDLASDSSEAIVTPTQKVSQPIQIASSKISYFSTASTVILSATKRVTKTWTNIATLTGHLSPVWTVAISPDGQTIASGSFDNTLKLWNLETGELINSSLGHSKPVLSVTFSPNGQILASASVDNTIKLWDFTNKSIIRTISGNLDSVVSISIAISPDGESIACGSDDRTIKIWQLNSGKLLHSLKDLRGFNYVAISPDGKILAGGSSDDTIKIWHFHTGTLINTLIGHFRDVNALAFSPDGQLLASGSSDHTIKVWDVHRGKLIRNINAHSDWVRSVAFSPDGKTLIGASDDAKIKIWSLNTGNLLDTLVGHTKDVNAIAISPDGQTIVSGSSDKNIKIWRCT